MISLHLDSAPVGECRLRFKPASAVETVRACLRGPDEAEDVCTGMLALSDANLLAFLSDVRGRRFKPGIFLDESVLKAVETFRRAGATVAAGRYLPDLVLEADGARAVWRPLDQGDAFFRRCVDALVRRAGRTPLEAELPSYDTVHDAWLGALRSDSGRVKWTNREDLAALAADLATWREPIDVSAAERAALAFTLVPPVLPTGTWRLAYPPPASRAGILSLGQAARLFPPLRHQPWPRNEAESFMRTGCSVLRTAGYAVTLPEGLEGEHLAAAAELDSAEARPAAVTSARPITARLVVHIDGETVSEADLVALFDQNSTLVYFHDHWIQIDRFALKEALQVMRAQKGRRLGLGEALGFACGFRSAGRLPLARVRAHGWLRGLLNELHGEERFHLLVPPKGLKAVLREYQLRGASYLAFLTHWGFGPCLADDMGLGKTVQTITWLLARKESSTGRLAPALVVAPVSVTANWMQELHRFAPGLKVYLHQGAARATGLRFQRLVRAADVVVTGYSLLVRDFRAWASCGFGALILDEAQMIKNPATRVAQAARALAVPQRVALTGTPLENSAADLWSLEEFLNPGLLGPRPAFLNEFVKPLRDDAHAPVAARLRHQLEPFLLRRLKTDPGVAAELGPKREIREWCALSASQRRNYEAALERYRTFRETNAGASLRGQMLALLTELKQVCDGMGEDEAAWGASGKVARLDALVETIFANGESVLIFSQYARVAARLRTHLEEVFGRRFPFLHGSLSSAQREAEIAAFNGSPEPAAFLLSLKAGGFGLNLVKASHVIHFDRWWNPAVENQATDRAHRIGQTQTVFVHLFITPGTLEERIDRLLEDKRALAGDLVGSGESFLLKMGEAEFERTVALT